MLFLVKRDAKTSLIAAALMGVAAYIAYVALDLAWRSPPSGWQVVEDGLFGLAVIAASDASLHTLLASVAPGSYTPAFRDLAGLFAAQRPGDWVAGGVTAGAEELLFRGVLVGAGVQVIGLSPIAAVALSALAFGLAHLLLTRRLWGFSVWAAWEGFLLGLFYVAGGSLGPVILAHGLHDLLGFWFFRHKRQQDPQQSRG